MAQTENEQVQSYALFPLAVALPLGARSKLELCIKDGIYTLRTWLQQSSPPSAKKSETVTFAFPATTWQHLKYQYFPSWLKEMFPVRLTFVEKKIEWVETINICPHINEPEKTHRDFLEGSK